MADESSRLKAFWADTFALVTFFTVAGAINEFFVAGMAWNEVALSRTIAIPMMILTARPYGIWRDWFIAVTSPKSATGYLVADSTALLAFQVPVYIGILVLSGASGWQLVHGAIGASVIMLFLGRPYGLWLETVRKWFNVKSS